MSEDHFRCQVKGLAGQPLQAALLRRLAQYDDRALAEACGAPVGGSEEVSATPGRAGLWTHLRLVIAVRADGAAGAARSAIESAQKLGAVELTVPELEQGDCIDHLLAVVSGLPVDRLRCGGFDDSDWLRISAAVDEIHSLPITLTTGAYDAQPTEEKR